MRICQVKSNEFAIGHGDTMKADEKVGSSVLAFQNLKKAMRVILATPKAEVERRDKEWRESKKK